MAIPPKPSPILLLTLTLTLTHILTTIPSSSAAAAAAGILSDLHSLRSHSPSGIIHLTDSLLNRIFKSTTRSFYLIIFFDAIQLHNKPEPNLKSIKSEFNLIAKSFIINNQNTSSISKIFFCDIEFTESEHQFLKFGVQSLPNIRILPHDATDPKSDSIPLDVGEHSALAESMAEFIEFKTKSTIAPIHRPPILSRTQLGFVVAGFLIWLPFMAKKVITGETILHNKRIWICGTIFVYFFSVSGLMFILIRRIPLFVMDRKDPNKLMFYYKGHGMQFGFEGMSVGFLFTLVGLLLAFITRVIVRMKDSTMQRLAMISAMIVSVWAVSEVVSLDHWKTGYFVHAYLPSSWYE